MEAFIQLKYKAINIHPLDIFHHPHRLQYCIQILHHKPHFLSSSTYHLNILYNEVLLYRNPPPCPPRPCCPLIYHYLYQRRWRSLSNHILRNISLRYPSLLRYSRRRPRCPRPDPIRHKSPLRTQQISRPPRRQTSRLG